VKFFQVKKEDGFSTDGFRKLKEGIEEVFNLDLDLDKLQVIGANEDILEIADLIRKVFRKSRIERAKFTFEIYNTYLLNDELYRKDQIYFTEKDKLYATKLKRLSDPEIYKDVRQETNFEKRYIHDRQLGAIPKWTVDENKFWS